MIQQTTASTTAPGGNDGLQQRQAAIAKIAEASAKISPIALRRLLDYALKHLSNDALDKVAGMAIAVLQQSEGKRQGRNARMVKPIKDDWRIGS